MVDDKTIIKVTNRSMWRIGYRIPDMGNLTRSFMPGETKPITAEEVRKLNWTPGGSVMLQDDLVLDNKELIEEILGQVEPEYNYTKEQVKDILLNGSMDKFMDTLDFAPDGVVDMMKDLAIELEIPDIRKRDALTEKTKVDITSAININHLSKEDNADQVIEVKQRRVATAADESTAPGRRITTQDKHNIVSK